MKYWRLFISLFEGVTGYDVFMSLKIVFISANSVDLALISLYMRHFIFAQVQGTFKEQQNTY